MPLEKELETYQKELPNLLSDKEKWVLIKGEEVVGTFSTSEDALKIGYEKFKLEPFLVKQIDENEKIFYFTRSFDIPCHM